MPKEEEKKKTPIWVWILLGILILLILLLLLFRPWTWFMFSTSPDYNYVEPEMPQLPDYPAETPEYPSQPELPVPEEPAQREFKTSDKLTEITFTRDLQRTEGEETVTVHETIKVSGYVQEVPLTQTNINAVINRAYIFKDGKLEWDIFGEELEADEEGDCDVTWTVEDKGSSVPDSNGKLQELSAGDMLAMSYSESGFDTFGPEIELVLKARIEMPEIQDIQINHENVVCQGETESTTFTLDYISVINLPLIIVGNPDTEIFTGSFETEYDSFEDSGKAFMKGGVASVPLDINFDDEDMWQVSYEIYVPA